MSGDDRLAGESTVRVLVVDDHQVVRDGVRRILEAAGMVVVDDVGTMAATMAAIARSEPDVVLLDVRLPDGSGIDLIASIRERFPTVRVLVLTSYAHPGLLEASLAAGAGGYRLKRISAGDLVDAVRRVAGGEVVIDPEAASLDHPPSVDPPELARLPESHRHILSLIGEGLTNRQIAERVFLSEKTVKNYVSTLLRSLGLRRRSEAAALAARLEARRATSFQSESWSDYQTARR